VIARVDAPTDAGYTSSLVMTAKYGKWSQFSFEWAISMQMMVSCFPPAQERTVDERNGRTLRRDFGAITHFHSARYEFLPSAANG
jgi:hypothetical protein